MQHGYVTASLERATPADGGAITFEPTAHVLRTSTGLYLPERTIRLERMGGDGAALVANDDPDLTPQPWQWRATFAIPGLPLEPVVFSLATGETVDVFDLVSVAIAPPIVEVVSDADRRRAEAAAERAEQAAAAAERYAADAGTSGGTSVTPAYLADQIQAHRDEPEPHVAYDQIPDLTVTYRNRKALA